MIPGMIRAPTGERYDTDWALVSAAWPGPCRDNLGVELERGPGTSPFWLFGTEAAARAFASRKGITILGYCNDFR
jgi:hypothetical protein